MTKHRPRDNAKKSSWHAGINIRRYPQKDANLWKEGGQEEIKKQEEASDKLIFKILIFQKKQKGV